MLVVLATETVSGAEPPGPASAMSAEPSVGERSASPLVGSGSGLVAAARSARLLSGTTELESASADGVRQLRKQSAWVSLGKAKAPITKAIAATAVTPENQYAVRLLPFAVAPNDFQLKMIRRQGTFSRSSVIYGLPKPFFIHPGQAIHK